MKKADYNLYRSIKSDLHKWFDKWGWSKNGTRLTIDVDEYSPELRQALDKLYRSYGFFPYGIRKSYEFSNMNARLIYLSFDSESEWKSISTIEERALYENALYDGFDFTVCRNRYNVWTWEKDHAAPQAGSDETGSDETGSDETGSDETGSDETGSDETGSDETGKITNITRNYRDFQFVSRDYKITFFKSIFSRTDSGKTWKYRADSVIHEDVSDEFYTNYIQSIPFFNNFGGFASCRAYWNYTPAGYMPKIVTTISPDNSKKIVAYFDFQYIGR